jgi:Tol biopolymer transport system component
MVRISPDGTKIALVVGARLTRDTLPSIWLFDQRTETLSQLTADPAGDDFPLWSPDSRRVFFRSSRGETSGIHAVDVETRETTLIGSSPEYPFALPWTISRDGRVLGLVNGLSLNDLNLATLTVADGKFARLLHEDPNESEPSFSPNGAWVAYAGTLGDPVSQVDIRPLPNVSSTLIRLGLGWSPLFSPDGSELFFVNGDAIYAAPISYEPTLRVSPPRRIFDAGAYLLGPGGRPWDVDPSGQRFLMIRRPGARDGDTQPSRESQQIDVVMNWFEELKTRVPTQ